MNIGMRLFLVVGFSGLLTFGVCFIGFMVSLVVHLL